MLRLAISVCAVAILLTACDDQALSRRQFVIERDTLVMYGDNSTLLPVMLVDVQGNETPGFKATIRRSEQSVLTSNGAWVRCHHAGTAKVHLSANGLADSILVECRTAQHLYPIEFVQMDLHDPPRSLSTTAIMASGDTETVRPVRIRNSDTSVVLVRNNEVVPRAVGRASLAIDYGGVRASAWVDVRDRIASGALTLNPGESRHWELSPGRYEITVKVRTAIDLTALRMETDGANCARSRRDEDMIHCVVNERGSVSMTNTSAPPRARASRALVTILRTP